MRGGTRVRLVLVALLAVSVAGAFVAFGPSPTQQPPGVDTASEDVWLVELDDEEGQLWPYTARDRDTETKTLPINVIVESDVDTTLRVLDSRSGRSWTVDSPEGEAVVVNGSGVNWSETSGATRYSYVETDRGGRWVEESAQIHDGTYLGHRYHLRLYEVSVRGDSWTAIQAHHEHWDWFRLRHTVESTASARYEVEHEFYGTHAVDDVRRERLGNGGALDSDGWVTVFDLADWKTRGGAAFSGGLLALLGVGAGLRSVVGGFRSAVGGLRTTLDAVGGAIVESRVGFVHFLMFAALLAAPLAVRITGVRFEQSFPTLPPKVIAAPLYMVLALGVPFVAGVLGRRLTADDAFVVATTGFGLGILFDYGWLGVTYLPVAIVVHRAVLVLGLGLVAAGGVRWASRPLQRHRYRVVGLGIWFGALVWPLLGL